MAEPVIHATTSLDRLAEKRADRAFLEALLGAPETRFLVLADGKPVINSNADRTEASLRWFERSELQSLGLPVLESLFLGVEAEGGGRFAVPITEHRARAIPGGRTLLHPIVDLRSLATQDVMSPEELSLAGQAAALAHWHENTRCCGRCGGGTVFKEGGWKRRCWACKHEFFPRMDPVVIMLVTDGERVVLAHESRFPVKMFSTLAGFLEPGDDVAHAVRRETREEVGLEIGEVRFLGSQPWPFQHSLMLGCIASAKPAELVVHTGEVEEARWFTRQEVAQMRDRRHPEGLWIPGPYSMAYALIETFLAEAAPAGA